jgi:hypothetical protein
MNKPKYHKVLKGLNGKPQVNSRVTADLIFVEFTVTNDSHHARFTIENCSDPALNGKNVVMKQGLWFLLFQKGAFLPNGATSYLPNALFYFAQDVRYRSIAVDEVNNVVLVYSYYEYSWR